MKLFLPAFALALACCAPAAAADFQVPPTPDHYVTDSAGALSGATRSSVETQLHRYSKSTGHQVVVWIDQTTGDVPLETWTGDTAHAWKIGRRGHDDGVVLFLFMRDHKVRIEVGYGLEGSLTDADSKRIIERDVIPAMRAGNPDRAVIDGVNAILVTITPSLRESGSMPTRPPASGGTSGVASAVGAIAIFLGLSIALLAVLMLIGRFLRNVKVTVGPSGGSFITSSSSSSSDDDFGSSDDDFDAGGGDFGGGGASGSW